VENVKNIKLIVEYDGTNYSGWQKQKNAITIQQVLEEALFKFAHEKIDIFGASRTDSGVHARGYACNFLINTKIPVERFRYILNNLLPDDIVILKSEEMPLEFHARYSCKGKRYIYTIINAKQRISIGRQYSYLFNRKLNVDLMRKAATYFIGTHDFEAFRSIGGNVKTSVRAVSELKIEQEGNFIRIIISADGFLYNMVRIITGTLIDVGVGRIKPDEIKNIIESKNRKRAGKCVPGKGLCLDEVFY
jgi:tRNA pseudouridine38-40 synthase